MLCLFFLTELVTIILRLSFGGFANQRRSNKRTVHRTEERTTEHTCYAEHVEGVHQDVVLCLENKHVVESTRDTKRHRIRERTLTERIDQEDCRCCCNRCRISNTDQDAYRGGRRTTLTHVGVDADEEVEDYELERTAVVQPSSREAASQMG